jgi:hypothetical protein
MPRFASAFASSPAVVVLAFTAASCSTPPPQVDPIPPVSLLAERAPPESQDLTTVITIARTKLDEKQLQEGVQPKPGFVCPANPRLVISVPVEEQQREERREDTQVAEGGLALSSFDFKTTGYFNNAEQQIKKSLLQKSFNLQDRAKFEAKLREQRSKRVVEVDSQPKQAEIEAANQRKDSGELTIDQWAEELKKIEKKYAQDAGAGRRPGQPKELVDISELIRATEEGEIQSDFILQVNTFRTQQLSDRRISLVDRPELIDLFKRHAGLRDAMVAKGVARITHPGFYGLLNAELIEVKSGYTVWVGAHRVDSERVVEFRIVVPIVKRVENASEIAAARAEYNRMLTRQRNACEVARAAIDDAVSADLGEAEIEQRVVGYRQQVDELVKAMSIGPPAQVDAPWRYVYEFGKITTIPEFPTDEVRISLQQEYRDATSVAEKRRVEQRALQVNEFMTAHFSELAKLVAKELIDTIPSQN